MNRTNIIYGGRDYDGTNVFFTHGSLDPWSSTGITEEDGSKPYIVKNIPGTYPYF